MGSEVCSPFTRHSHPAFPVGPARPGEWVSCYVSPRRIPAPDLSSLGPFVLRVHEVAPAGRLPCPPEAPHSSLPSAGPSLLPLPAPGSLESFCSVQGGSLCWNWPAGASGQTAGTTPGNSACVLLGLGSLGPTVHRARVCGPTRAPPVPGFVLALCLQPAAPGSAELRRPPALTSRAGGGTEGHSGCTPAPAHLR